MNNAPLFITKKNKPRISLTPLIDVVFLLLVFLMLSSHFQRYSSLTLSLPTHEASSTTTLSQDQTLVMLEIIDEHTVQVNQHTLALFELMTYLQEQCSPEDVIAIESHEEVSLQTLITVVHQLGDYHVILQNSQQAPL